MLVRDKKTIPWLKLYLPSQQPSLIVFSLGSWVLHRPRPAVFGRYKTYDPLDNTSRSGRFVGRYSFSHGIISNCHVICTIVMWYTPLSCDMHHCHVIYIIVMWYAPLSCDMHHCHVIYIIVMWYAPLSCDMHHCHVTCTIVMWYAPLLCDIHHCHVISIKQSIKTSITHIYSADRAQRHTNP